MERLPSRAPASLVALGDMLVALEGPPSFLVYVYLRFLEDRHPTASPTKGQKDPLHWCLLVGKEKQLQLPFNIWKHRAKTRNSCFPENRKISTWPLTGNIFLMYYLS